MKRLIYTLLVMCLALPSVATNYERHKDRMNDHFNHSEWNEVRQEANEIIKIRPNCIETYSAAIIAAQFMNDIHDANKYLKKAQLNRVHIDSLLHNVYLRTKRIHNAQVYEKLLINLKGRNKGLARIFNLYLLEFYTFARKNDETINIANELLFVTPQNNRFKKIKANALFSRGDTKEAVKLYEDVLKKDSTDFEVLTFLGAYYTTQNYKDLNQIDSMYIRTEQPESELFIAQKQQIIETQVPRTIDLLQRAYKIRNTDLLNTEIQKLQSLDSELPQHPSMKKRRTREE